MVIIMSNFFRSRGKLLRVIDGDTVEMELDLGFKLYKKITLRLLRKLILKNLTENILKKQRGKRILSKIGLI